MPNVDGGGARLAAGASSPREGGSELSTSSSASTETDSKTAERLFRREMAAQRRQATQWGGHAPYTGSQHQVSSLPHLRPLSLCEEDWRDDGRLLRLDDVRVLLSHNFFEESRGRVWERIRAFLKAERGTASLLHDQAEVESAEERALAAGVGPYLRIRGGCWFARVSDIDM